MAQSLRFQLDGPLEQLQMLRPSAQMTLSPDLDLVAGLIRDRICADGSLPHAGSSPAGLLSGVTVTTVHIGSHARADPVPV